jgi:hypothetical protein
MRHGDRTAGLALAAIAASLFAAMPLTSGAHSDGEEGHPHGVNGKCVGGNACKGQSACKTAGGQCAGQNACKGQGFSITTAEDCEAKAGTFEAV